LLWFSLPFSLLLPHNHFGVLEVYFSLQIRLVSNLDAWSDFLDIPKKAFNSLPLYRVQELKRYSWNVKLSKEYFMNHFDTSSLLFDFITCVFIIRSWFYHLYLFYYLLHYYRVGSTTCIYFIIYCITTKLVLPHVSILSFIALLRSWFYHMYLFYHLLHSYRVGSTTLLPYHLRYNIILLGFMFKCYVTKCIMLCFSA
jgi:hypothetical protein